MERKTVVTLAADECANLKKGRLRTKGRGKQMPDGKK